MGCTSAKGEACGDKKRRVKKSKTLSTNKNIKGILEPGSEIYEGSKILDEKTKNFNVEYEKKSSKINRTIMTSTTKETIQLEIDDNILFPPGEHYYQLIKDCNKTKLIEKFDNLSERVELFFSLNNIYFPNNKYSFGISIINNKNIGNATFLGYLKDGTGETIEFGESFELDFFFEREQIVIIEPIINGKSTEQKKQFILCTLMTSRNNKIIIEIEDIGSMEISYNKLKNQDKEITSEISCFQFTITLNNEIFKNTQNLNNIFYVLRNIKDGKKRRPVYKSHEYSFELNKPQQTSLISLDSDLLCSDNNSEIFFELYSPEINQKKHIGFNSFTLNKLKSNLNHDKIEEIEIKSNEYGNLGVLQINYNNSKKISLEQFIKKGQINLDIAIDYTSSNGFPKNQSSLHYMYGKEPNDYEKAIRSCGDIIAYYDTDQLFPVYGFGGIPDGQKEVSHCFNINFNENDPNIIKVDNIIKFYKESLEKVKLYGPTHFSPVIRKVMSEINDDLKYRKEENHYYVLMILTDGIINDVNETIDCIVEASKLPLSIIIIGIGTADFTNMEILDGDEKPLINTFGEIRKRDIVQFVEFKRFKDENGINNGTELAEEVLKEIPRQLEEYYHFCGKFYE